MALEGDHRHDAKFPGGEVGLVGTAMVMACTGLGCLGCGDLQTQGGQSSQQR